MILLILAGIWAAVLIPPILRSRAESSPADSIGDFRRQLRVLQRTGPSRGVAPDAVVAGRYVEYVDYADPVEPAPLRAVQEARPRAGERPVPPRSGHQPGPSRPVRSVAVPAAVTAKRARTVRRRRDVMFTLLMGMGTTFVLAMVVSSSALWMLHLLMDGLFLGFVAMLVRMRSVAAEKEMKLRILPQPTGRPQPVPVLAMRRSATN